MSRVEVSLAAFMVAFQNTTAITAKEMEIRLLHHKKIQLLRLPSPHLFLNHQNEAAMISAATSTIYRLVGLVLMTRNPQTLLIAMSLSGLGKTPSLAISINMRRFKMEAALL